MTESREDVLVAAYFNTRPDPQRDRRVVRDDFSYMKSWYASVNRLGLHATVLYDRLRAGFRKQFTTDRIHFERVRRLKFNPVDSKWVCLRRYVEQNEIERLFLTDIWDVTVVRDPFRELRKFSGKRLFCGNEPRFLDLPWLRHYIDAIGNPRITAFFDAHPRLPLLNAGVFGGYADTVRPFVAEMESLIRQIKKPKLMVDMVLFNYLLYTKYEGSFTSGFPVTSEFGAFEERRDVWFIHK